ncbi:MAG: DUF1028 domain-containing protein [Pseudomonadota bacterium]
MTFSLVARCAETGMFGMAVASSSPAVAARCAHARAKVGAAASQNVTDPALGPRLLDLMAKGQSADEALRAVTAEARHIEYRQLMAIDARGGTAIYSGAHILGVWGEARGIDVAAAGNLLAHHDVPHAMVTAFEQSRAHLGDRVLDALRAGLEAGGEAGPVHSAGMVLVDQAAWPIADLRCDWSEACPIEALAQAWGIYKPQMDDYLRRALDPGLAPSYGVPGDV